jgi:aldose 1-epimerase
VSHALPVADDAAGFGQRSLLTLRAAGYEARVAPAAGGRLASLDWVGEGGPRPLLVPWGGQPFDPHAWPKAGAFPMLPFANRLAPGGFMFRGRRVRPEPGPQGFALHGLAHRRAWQVLQASQDSAALQLVHRPDDHWPWAFTATQSIQLGPQGLSLTLGVRNDSDEAMPLSIGWHPYHPVGDAFTAAGLRIRAAARHDMDPKGRAVEEARAPVTGMAPGETAAFSGWDGEAWLQSASEGAIAVAAPGCDRLVLHAPPGGDYLCVEPVTQLPGRLAEPAASRPPAWLEPGQAQALAWRCAWKPTTAPAQASSQA